MAFDKHRNNARGVVVTPPSPATTGTSLILETGQGAKFPEAPFNFAVWPATGEATEENQEIIRVRKVTGDKFEELIRGEEESKVRAIVAGDRVALVISRKVITDVETAITTETTARIAADALLVPLTQKGATSGVATLDSATKIPNAQIPIGGGSSAQVLTKQKGAVSLDLSKYNIFVVELEGSTTFTFTNVPAIPVEVTVITKQDAVGGRTFHFEGIEWIGPEPLWETGAGTRSAVQILIDGSEKLAWGKAGGSIASTSSAIQFFGANIQATQFATETQSNSEIKINVEAHAKLIRINARWETIEFTKGTFGGSDLTKVDNQINKAAASGIKVICTCVTTPKWASTGTGGGAHEWNYMPTEPHLFGVFCRKIVERYGSKLAAIEIWNEPNPPKNELLRTDGFAWTEAERAKGYSELVKAAYAECKGLGVPVVMGAFSYFDKAGGESFLKLMYEAPNSLKGNYDGISVHPYADGNAPELEFGVEHSFRGAIKRLKTFMEANGDNTKIWISEFGWAVAEKSISETTRAEYLKKSFEIMAALPYIAGGTWFQTRDGGSGKFGMVNEAFEAYEPISKKYQEAMKSLYG